MRKRRIEFAQPTQPSRRDHHDYSLFRPAYYCNNIGMYNLARMMGCVTCIGVRGFLWQAPTQSADPTLVAASQEIDVSLRGLAWSANTFTAAAPMQPYGPIYHSSFASTDAAAVVEMLLRAGCRCAISRAGDGGVDVAWQMTTISTHTAAEVAQLLQQFMPRICYSHLRDVEWSYPMSGEVARLASGRRLFYSSRPNATSLDLAVGSPRVAAFGLRIEHASCLGHWWSLPIDGRELTNAYWLGHSAGIAWCVADESSLRNAREGNMTVYRAARSWQAWWLPSTLAAYGLWHAIDAKYVYWHRTSAADCPQRTAADAVGTSAGGSERIADLFWVRAPRRAGLFPVGPVYRTPISAEALAELRCHRCFTAFHGDYIIWRQGDDHANPTATIQDILRVVQHRKIFRAPEGCPELTCRAP